MEADITATVEVNGRSRTFVFNGVGQTSKVFGARSVTVPETEKELLVAYGLKRFVFE